LKGNVKTKAKRVRSAGWRAALGLAMVLGVVFGSGVGDAWGQSVPAGPAQLADEKFIDEVYVRFKVIRPAAAGYQITTGGFRHDGPQWYLPQLKGVSVAGGWSEWFHIPGKQLPKLKARVGGIAEWPSMTGTFVPVGPGAPVKPGVQVQIQIADAPSESQVVIDTVESSASQTVGFLLPHPIRKYKDQFETGSQMMARQLAWARESVARLDPGLAVSPIKVKKFTVMTALWGHYDPALEKESLDTLRWLGFNSVGNASTQAIKEAGMKTYGTTWNYTVSPEEASRDWTQFVKGALAKELQTAIGKWKYENLSHFVVSDETKVLDFSGVDRQQLSGWFRGYLSSMGVRSEDLPTRLESVEYPLEAMKGKSLKRDVDLKTRRLYYYAAKFGQWWSAKQLKHSSDLIKGTFADVPTETLPSDHAFFNAWGAPHVGMGYKMLDLIQIGRDRVVDIIAAEDWLGLNHMYGPKYTWTGAQSFAYMSAILRSGMTGHPEMELMGLITPSDDRYLRLKAYSNIGQGSKTLFYWTFGPTYIGTENYWSDLKSMYDGVAQTSKALADAEDVLFEARPVRDPVAILYSVSNDIWHTEDPASFVETRLLWHGLRHVQIQPDFLNEEDVGDGKLKDYKVLYVTGQTLTRKAAQAIARWVKTGGIVYLSAGAATRDEFYEPAIPGFAVDLWPADAAMTMVREKHEYNERVDLPTIAAMNQVTLDLAEGKPDGKVKLPVIGGMVTIPEPRRGIWGTGMTVLGRFEQGGGIASAMAKRGGGYVYVNGFFPMLAYGQMAGFKPTTLEEVWPAGPRALIRLPLKQAKVVPVAEADRDVVETNLLTGPKGSCVVLCNYTYKPITKLVVTVRVKHPVTKVRSTEGLPVKIIETLKDGGVRIELPLDLTDIVVLEP
jgi:hypothetical protein